MIKKVILSLALLLFAALPAVAQFADQATYAGAGGGTANAQTLTLANATSYADLLGVIVKYVPSATNTGSATLNVNGFGSSPQLRKANGSGLTALTGGEIVSGQPTFVFYDGTYFNVMAPLALPIGSSNLLTSSFGFNAPANLQINATVSANQLTLALKGANGSDASSANPIQIAFRDTTIANGDPVWVTLASSLSFTIGSGSTMGCVSGQMCRLWVVAINNSGTIALCAFNAKSGASIASISEANLQTSASGTSGGNSAQTYYCGTSAVTAKAVRILGYVDIQEVTAGTWAAGPTYVQLFGPGIKRPGDVVQTVYTTNSTTTSPGTSLLTSTNLTQNFSPSSAANVVQVQASGTISIGAGFPANSQIYNGSTAVGSLVQCATNAGANPTCPASMLAMDNPNSTSSQTYVVKISSTAGGGSITWNPNANPCVMVIKEIMGALEPANDDVAISRVG